MNDHGVSLSPSFHVALPSFMGSTSRRRMTSDMGVTAPAQVGGFASRMSAEGRVRPSLESGSQYLRASRNRRESSPGPMTAAARRAQTVGAPPVVSSRSSVPKRSVVSKSIELGDEVEVERERVLLTKLTEEVR